MKGDKFTQLRDRKYWLKNIVEIYPPSLLILVAMQFFNEGFIIMKMLANQKLYKDYYMLEPGQAQLFGSLAFIGGNLRIFCGFFIDSRILDKRKTILIIFGSLQLVTQALLTFYEFEDASSVVICLCINHFALTFCDTTVESFIIQQARRDPEDGQQDLQAFRSFCFGLGTLTGCIIAAFAL